MGKRRKRKRRKIDLRGVAEMLEKQREQRQQATKLSPFFSAVLGDDELGGLVASVVVGDDVGLSDFVYKKVRRDITRARLMAVLRARRVTHAGDGRRFTASSLHVDDAIATDFRLYQIFTDDEELLKPPSGRPIHMAIFTEGSIAPPLRPVPTETLAVHIINRGKEPAHFRCKVLGELHDSRVT